MNRGFALIGGRFFFGVRRAHGGLCPVAQLGPPGTSPAPALVLLGWGPRRFWGRRSGVARGARRFF
eukprot:CAMPEP_0181275894 /NCGR_PEP_ID=MMETSP1097-20121128/10158_1 /TAXON_ID=35684 /ORGANISM="Pseudopedinella elastica, Strain CCMP716" /LENGTH=65 /DNA_ID=CAMNT_0023377381 /DNA_START=12 /DNA_END=206 /DNA_ORIENTATION=-